MKSAGQDQHALALDYLRGKAVSAHEGGDGLLTNHICSIALESVSELLEKAQRKVALADVRWAVILSLYWLIDGYTLHRVRHVVDLLKKSEEKPTAVLDAVYNLMFLLRQSLHPAHEAIEALKAMDASWIDPAGAAEDGAFLSLSVELAFFRQPGGPGWLELADTWIEKCPEVHVGRLSGLTNRLKLQAKALYPGLSGGLPDGSVEDLSRKERSLYQAWEDYLGCDWESLRRKLDQMAVSGSLGSEDSLSVFDMHHTVWQPWQRDPQLVGLSRRKLVSSGRQGAFEHLVDDYRDAAFYKGLASLWEGGAEKGAEARFDCVRLAMLNEISALRQWNLPVVSKALHQQGLTSRELVRFFGDKPSERSLFAAQSVRLLTLCGKIDEKDPVHKHLVSLLDLAGDDIRANLVAELISVRRYRWSKVMSALFLLCDAIPEDLLVPVAEWCVAYDDAATNQLGERVDRISFWGNILGYVANTAEICNVLHPIMVKAAGLAVIWRVASRSALQRYLACAPLEMAAAVGEAMFGVPVDEDEELNSLRWATVYNASRERPEIADAFRDHLIRTAATPILGFYADIIDVPAEDLRPRDDENTRAWLRERLATSAENIRRRSGPSFAIGGSVDHRLAGMLTWPDAETQLVEDLVAAIESAHILPHEVVDLVLCLGELAVRNPAGHVPLLRDPVNRWLRDLPLGEQPFAGIGGPLSTLQVNMPTREDAYAAICRVIEIMCDLDTQEMGPIVASWLLSVYSQAPREASGVLFRLGVGLGVNNEFLEERDVLSLMLLTVHQALMGSRSSDDDCQDAIALISQLAALLDPACSGMCCLARPQNVERAGMVLDPVAKLLPRFAEHPSVDLRAGIARLLSNWASSQPVVLPAELVGVMEALRKDARARVRYLATLSERRSEE